MMTELVIYIHLYQKVKQSNQVSTRWVFSTCVSPDLDKMLQHHTKQDLPVFYVILGHAKTVGV